MSMFGNEKAEKAARAIDTVLGAMDLSHTEHTLALSMALHQHATFMDKMCDVKTKENMGDILLEMLGEYLGEEPEGAPESEGE